MPVSIRFSRRPFAAGAALALLVACGDSSAPGDDSGGAPAADANGWLTLFDGASLDSFNIVGDANWRVEDGAAVADESSAASFLVTPDSYDNFELELEFWVNTEANSGVFFRCQDPEAISDTSCYEANIFDTRPDQTYRTGSIVNIAAPAEFIYTGGQWNRYQITANGSSLEIMLNGRDMVSVDDSTHTSGPIALQYGQGVVRFRNVRLRPL